MKCVVRILTAALAVLLGVGFAACGAAPAAGETAETTETTAAAAGSYRIYSDNAFAPFEFLDTAANKYIGVDMELLAAIAEDQGFTYEMKNEDINVAEDAVRTGQADALIAGVPIEPEKQEDFDFSDGYFTDGFVLVVKQNSVISFVEDLKGKTVSAKKGAPCTDYAESIKDQYGFTIAYYDDSQSVYQAVINGSADACFEDFSVIGWAIKNEGLALQTVGEIANPKYYGFAVRKGENAELIALFNAGLSSLKTNGKYEEILAKYGY